MNDLQSLVQGYLESAGFNLLDVREGFLVADRMDVGGGHDTRLIWTPQLPEHEKGFRQLERRLLEDLENTIPRYPDAKRFLVLDSFAGFSKEFWGKADGFGIERRVAIQFFDTPFKWEEAPEEVRSAIKDLRDPNITWKRIPQPYILFVEGEPEKGEDLFEHLFEELRWPPEGPCLRIIVGPAGIGKTFLFRALFYNLYEHFLRRKREQELLPRPIPLIPAYLRRVPVLRMQALIDNFIHEDVAKPISRSTFEWMLVHGFLIWLFDGLDELYAGDRSFFDDILDLLTREDSKAQILIFARDSLLTSCEGLAQFIEDFPPDREDAFRLYQLEDWDYPSKRRFVELHLEEPKATRFLNLITQSGPLRSLSSLPYYCDLLMNEYKRGNPVADFMDDLALIEYVVSGIIKREEERELLLREQFQPGGLDEWLETLASECYEGNFAGLPREEVEVYARLVLSDGLTEEERDGAITTLLRFPLFASGPEPGTILFKHELITEYLAGRFLSRRITAYPARVGEKLGARVDLADSLIARCIASNIPRQQGGLQALVNTLKTGGLSGRAFANLLQLLLLTTPARDIIKSSGIVVEGRDLRCVKFVRRDLQGVSFRNCDLTNTTFRNCNLRGARFEGAYLTGTRFEKISREKLEGARFGNLERFHSIYVGKRRIDDFQQALEWVQKMTGQGKEIKGPCPTALQLKTLFGKFIYPDGSPRRAELGERSLIRGKRHPRAPTPEECIEACLHFGYLQGPDYRNRISRARGDRYSDMVEFVRNWDLSPELRRLLDSLCLTTGCEHIPASL